MAPASQSSRQGVNPKPRGPADGRGRVAASTAGDELLSIREDEPSSDREARRLFPILKGFDEIRVDVWILGAQSCNQVRGYDTDYSPEEDARDEDTEDTPVIV
jgi:hypothetical protein